MERMDGNGRRGGVAVKGGGRLVDDMINSGTGTLPGVHQPLISHSWWKKEARITSTGEWPSRLSPSC